MTIHDTITRDGGMPGSTGRGQAQTTPDRIGYLKVAFEDHLQMTRDVVEVTGGNWPADRVVQSIFGQRIAEKLRISVPNIARFIDSLVQEEIDAIYMVGLPTSKLIAKPLALALAYLHGEPFNYEPQNGGELVMELIPDLEAGENNNATTGEFGAHTDDAAMPFWARTRFISLYGLVNPPGTLTGYASTERALDMLSVRSDLEFVNRILCEPRFEVRFPTSFKLGEDVWKGPMAILRPLESGGFETRFPSYAVRPFDPSDHEGAAAIAAFLSALMEHTVYVPVDPGAYLSFNNARGAHCRGAVGEGDRHILRTYALPDLSELRNATQVAGPVFPLTPFVKKAKR